MTIIHATSVLVGHMATFLAFLGASCCALPSARPDFSSASLELANLCKGPSSFELKAGDRVVLLGNTFLERDRHYGYFETMLRCRFPGRRFSVRNLAWPGDTTTVQLRPANYGNMEDHIVNLKPTVIFVCFGMNESFEGPGGVGKYLEGYRKYLDMLAKTKARIIIVSPIRHENLGPPLPDPAAHNQSLKLYVEATRRLALERGYIFVDLFATVVNPAGSVPANPLTENGIHLTSHGYWRAAEEVARALDLASDPWKVQIGVDDRRATSTGTQVTDLQATDRSVSFKAKDSSLPLLPPDGPESAGRRFLRVAGLATGKYTLRIDGQAKLTATAEEWSRGIEPPDVRPRRLREEIIKKDKLFFDRWRAHNGEYIYGSRSKAGGGNAGNPSFPPEMAELDRLLRLADEKITELSRPQVQTYELVAQ